MELQDDQHVMAGLMRVLQKLFDPNKEFQVFKGKFNFYFYTLLSYHGNHVWSLMEMKEVAHVWWFTIDSAEKLLPCFI